MIAQRIDQSIVGRCQEWARLGTIGAHRAYIADSFRIKVMARVEERIQSRLRSGPDKYAEAAKRLLSHAHSELDKNGAQCVQHAAKFIGAATELLNGKLPGVVTPTKATEFRADRNHKRWLVAVHEAAHAGALFVMGHEVYSACAKYDCTGLVEHKAIHNIEDERIVSIAGYAIASQYGAAALGLGGDVEQLRKAGLVSTFMGNEFDGQLEEYQQSEAFKHYASHCRKMLQPCARRIEAMADYLFCRPGTRVPAGELIAVWNSVNG